MNNNKVFVWDLATRLFHLILIITITTALLTGFFPFKCMIQGYQIKSMAIHFIAGKMAFALIIFRIIWGFFGSIPSRFVTFVSFSPLKIISYFRKVIGGDFTTNGYSHTNAGGAISIFFIIIIFLQSISGMSFVFLKKIIGKPVAGALHEMHEILPFILLGLITLHIISAILYQINGNKLITAMITGYKEKIASLQDPKMITNTNTNIFLFITLVTGSFIIINYLLAILKT